MANWAYKAYGDIHVFKSKHKLYSHAMEWLVATEGSERTRAAAVLAGLESGRTYIDTDVDEV